MHLLQNGEALIAALDKMELSPATGDKSTGIQQDRIFLEAFEALEHFHNYRGWQSACHSGAGAGHSHHGRGSVVARLQASAEWTTELVKMPWLVVPNTAGS